ncbi:hypothetical protein ACQEVZ_32820 [Dactylosporangium sp. CA-152071]|uniref:hypothetical protein n=1 Tax=Dactylosporangium sp. CA-152071 TaxID=3239933 RepID=UPI003D8AE94A
MAKDLWWRIGVPAVGLVVAMAVGWRLAHGVVAPVVVCAWLPLAAWCLFAPRVRAALPIALVLLAAIATIRWTLPGQPGDRSMAIVVPTLIWYLVPGGVALLVAATRRSQPFRTVPTLVACGALALACGVGVLSWNQVGEPSPDELFPLPAGLTATSATGPNGTDGCDQGGHACWTYYRVTGTAGDSTAALTERLRRHLQETKGWGTLAMPGGASSESCRPVRRLGRPATTDLCIAVTSDPAGTPDRPAIGVELSMSKIGRAP